LAGRYTLLEQASARGVMSEAARRDVGVLVGGPFNSGLLAKAREPGATYNYGPVDERTLERAGRIYEICAAKNVDVGAAALQFVLAHPAVVTVVAGMRSATEVSSAVERLHTKLPESLWHSLRAAGLLDAAAPVP
jgi:D-threo-aldose 1-dehydrogenase